MKTDSWATIPTLSISHPRTAHSLISTVSLQTTIRKDGYDSNVFTYNLRATTPQSLALRILTAISPNTPPLVTATLFTHKILEAYGSSN